MMRVLAVLVLLAVPVLAFAQPGFLSLGSSGEFTVADSDADFLARRSGAGVVRWFGFETNELAINGGPVVLGNGTQPVAVFVFGNPPLDNRVEFAATDQVASGSGSLKFWYPSETGAGYQGQFMANFADDYSVQFGEGEEFYVQWRQRMDTAFLDYDYLPSTSGWKQAIITEGDRPGVDNSSCEQLEIVPVQYQWRGVPTMYHSCGGKDGKYEALFDPVGAFDFELQPTRGCLKDSFSHWSWPSIPEDCFRYYDNEWMTFEVRVQIGTWYQNDGNYYQDSTIQMWAARECQPPELVIDYPGYDIANTDSANAKYGAVFLTPYTTGKDATQVHPDAYTWYDELIISTAEIPFPCQDGAALPTTQ